VKDFVFCYYDGMIDTITRFFRGREWLLIGLLVITFVAIRLPGTDLPLHQDEYKWPMIVNPAIPSDTEIPHPPLSQFIYRTAGYIVGFDVHFRFVPLFFGTLNLLLLYYFMRMQFGKKEAVIASLIWIFSYFSVLASLMVDTDGEIMPFFFLLALIGYYKSKNAHHGDKWKGITLLVVSSVLGFFIKVSFLLAIFAIGADFFWSKKGSMKVLDMVKYFGYAVLSGVVLVALLVIAQKIFPFFSLKTSLTYWEHFWATDRNWFQTAIQCAKAVLYTSPFLILVPFLAPREIWNKLRVLVFFITGALFFYVILFDFSIGALDRYMQFLILPLTIIVGVVIGKVLSRYDKRTKEFILLGTLVGFILIILQFIPHYIPPLHPKSEWVSRALSLRWNFVYPFSGGSGPLGFYVSFLFMALAWIISLVATVFAFFRPHIRKFVIVFLLVIGFVYNVVFIEEYLFGYINGSAPRLLTNAVVYIQKNPDIDMVTVYNDNGGNEIRAIGKYRKRLYVDPKFDLDIKVATLNEFKEHYFVLDVPRLDPTSVYQKYFDSCKVIYKQTDRKMSATVYDCRNVPDIHI